MDDPGSLLSARVIEVQMIDLKAIAAGTAIAGALGFAALGIGSGVANAAPSPIATQTSWAQNPGWGHGPGPWGGGGWNNGPGWGPPPAYDYGGYGGYDNYGPGCVTGPLGLLHFGNC
jgi:hypothetical protein